MKHTLFERMEANIYPVVIPRVLPDKQYKQLQEEINILTNWNLSNKSVKTGGRSWAPPIHDKQNPYLFHLSTIINLKLQKIIKKRLRLCRIHINGQTAGQPSEFHIDYDLDNVWTFILFSDVEWDTEWGGEFVCQNPVTKKYTYVEFKPNSGVLIPSNWSHRGTSPLPCTDNLRMTVAFSYCTRENFDILLKKVPTNVFWS